jgi:predicted kinase
MISIKRFESYNKSKLVWIHGLPGSGKTTIANQINKNKDFIILDDISNISDLENELNKGNNIILSSPYFDNYLNSIFSGETKLRTTLKDYDYDIEEIWFENDLQTCIQNLNNRTEHKISTKQIIPDMKQFSKDYKIPSSVKAIPVWSKNK